MFATLLALTLTAAPAHSPAPKAQVVCQRYAETARERHQPVCTKAQLAAYDKARFDSLMHVLAVQAQSAVQLAPQAPAGELTPMQVAAQGGPQYAIVHVNGESVHVSYTVGE